MHPLAMAEHQGKEMMQIILRRCSILVLQIEMISSDMLMIIDMP
jgi:hypothetical protein